MEGLPVEVKAQIFMCLPDMIDVKKLRQVSVSLSKSFIGSKSTIIQAVLKNFLDPELFQEILAVAKSVQLKVRSRIEVIKILDDCFTSQPTLGAITWDLRTALIISELQEIVQILSSDFVSCTLARPCLTNEDGSSGPAPSRSELRRIERNFWKFELYCNLFRSPKLRGPRSPDYRILPEEQIKVFFDRFAAFENEQLGRVHDYLWNQVSSSFNDVAAHDVEWAAEWSVDWVQDCYSVASNWKEALLSRGLSKINELKNAQTYEERYDLVQGEFGCPDWDNEFLVRGLSLGDGNDSDISGYLEEMTIEQAKLASKKPSYSDIDDGPFEAWKWAHPDWRPNSFFSTENWVFRQRGYVTWDHNRIIYWNIFNVGRSDLPPELEEAYRPPTPMIGEQKKSIQARSEIFEKGGTGWWESDDLSRVLWPKDRCKRIPKSGIR